MVKAGPKCNGVNGIDIPSLVINNVINYTLKFYETHIMIYQPTLDTIALLRLFIKIHTISLNV